MTALAINPATIAPAWSALQRALPIKIGAIHNEAEYDSVVSFMNSLLDVVGDNEEYELADLLDLVAQLVEDYKAHATRRQTSRRMRCCVFSWISTGSNKLTWRPRSVASRS